MPTQIRLPGRDPSSRPRMPHLMEKFRWEDSATHIVSDAKASSDLVYDCWKKQKTSARWAQLPLCLAWMCVCLYYAVWMEVWRCRRRQSTPVLSGYIVNFEGECRSLVLSPRALSRKAHPSRVGRRGIHRLSLPLARGKPAQDGPSLSLCRVEQIRSPPIHASSKLWF